MPRQTGKRSGSTSSGLANSSPTVTVGFLRPRSMRHQSKKGGLGHPSLALVVARRARSGRSGWHALRVALCTRPIVTAIQFNVSQAGSNDDWMTLRLIQQVSRPHTERLREPLDNGNSRISSPAFDVADIGAVDAGAVGVVLLTPALRLAEATNIPAEARANIHTKLKTAMSAIDLQTMSDIALDLPVRSSMCPDTHNRQSAR